MHSKRQTEHPYIVHVKGVCSRPIIKGTRISVRHVAQLYKAGYTIEALMTNTSLEMDIMWLFGHFLLNVGPECHVQRESFFCKTSLPV
ncbi:MAG: DUF433 domain-containing protein [Deltaproteobacteria bacterium]|nr:DUF433 domain-containing protein [Deltaproteobacteria bacterium]